MFQTSVLTIPSSKSQLNLKLRSDLFSFSMLPDDVINHIFKFVLISNTIGVNHNGFEQGLRQLFRLGITQKNMYRLYSQFMVENQLWKLVESVCSPIICDVTEEHEDEDEGCGSTTSGLPGEVSNEFYCSLKYNHPRLRVLDLQDEQICEHLMNDVLSQASVINRNLNGLRLHTVTDNTQLFNYISKFEQLTSVSIHSPSEKFVHMLTTHFQFLNNVHLSNIQNSARKGVCKLIQSFHQISSSTSTIEFKDDSTNNCTESLSICLEPPSNEVSTTEVQVTWKLFLSFLFGLDYISRGEFSASSSESDVLSNMALNLKINLRREFLQCLFEALNEVNFVKDGWRFSIGRGSKKIVFFAN